MPNGQLHPIRRLLQELVGPPWIGQTDSQLLEQFLAEQDEAAFAALVRRHGPLVLGVCRRVLRHAQDAEDAFQATFLVLARKAGSIGKREALPSWLFGVAYRVASRARVQAARRVVREKQVETMTTDEHPDDVEWQDLRRVLDEEINRLSAKYRQPLILCYLQGRTNEEAAQQLSCPVGTIVSRLARARQRLRDRLARRGLAVSLGALTVLPAVEAQAVPPAVVHATTEAALLFQTGQVVAGTVSPQAAALAKGVLRTMFLTKTLMTAALAVAVMLCGAGAGVLAFQAQAQKPNPNRTSKPAADNTNPPERPGKQQVPGARDGILLFLGTEIKEGEKVPPEQTIQVKAGDENKTYRRLKAGDMVEAGQLVGRMDDRLARTEVAIRKVKQAAAEAELVAAEKTHEEARIRYERIQKLRATGQVSEEEASAGKLTAERYAQEVVGRKAGVEVARLELQAAQTLVEMHELRSGGRGRIKTLLKLPGEAVKALEPVVEIEIVDRPE